MTSATSNQPFDLAVADYIAGLSASKRQVLCTGVLSPLSARHWPFYVEVINRYNLRDGTSPVRRDIADRIAPDLQAAHSVLWARGGSTEPIFEATTFMSAVQAALRRSAG